MKVLVFSLAQLSNIDVPVYGVIALWFFFFSIDIPTKSSGSELSYKLEIAYRTIILSPEVALRKLHFHSVA